MQLFALGLNHRTAPLAIREKVAFGPEKVEAALVRSVRSGAAREAVIVSTCNRTELYVVAHAPERAIEWLADYHALSTAALSPYLYTLSSREAVAHLFGVASGLDSMVLGEPQILGQIKQAARFAQSAGTLGSVLHPLFDRSFAVAKAVRGRTSIGQNVVSLAAAALHLAERVFGDLSAERVLLIGAGEMIELCAAHCAGRSPARLAVINRHPERAAALAQRYQAQCLSLDQLPEVLHEFDLVLSSTASPIPIIGLGLVERALRARRHRPMVMIDLAVPRDIEPEVGALDDVFLYTVDDLGRVVEDGRQSRQSALEDARAIVDREVEEYLRWVDLRKTVPLIRSLREEAERLRFYEVQRAVKLLARGHSPEQALEVLSKRLTHQFLHGPTRLMHDANRAERSPLARLFARLFAPRRLD
jgi:glutamyl-tRNA reductase